MPLIDEIDAELNEIEEQLQSLLARRDELQSQRAALLLDTKNVEVREQSSRKALVNWHADFEWASRMDDLKRMFNVSEWRFDQRAIINCTLSKTDTFVIMPTGGGKRFVGRRVAPSGPRRGLVLQLVLFCSLCYQLPAVLSGGVTCTSTPTVRALAPSSRPCFGGRLRLWSRRWCR